jgi:hypothetical protein
LFSDMFVVPSYFPSFSRRPFVKIRY